MKWIQTWFGAAAFCWLLFTFNTHAATHYVDANGANPVSPYADWSTAATNIQDAIDASTDGDLVLVTNGVYATGGRVVYGSLTNRVVINKAVTVQSINGPEVTTICGNRPVGANAVRCVYLTTNAALIGFTLTNGATLATGDKTREEMGGGLWAETTNAFVVSCLVISNMSQYGGSGVFRGCITDSTLNANRSVSGTGAGAGYSILTNCLVSNNYMGSGPGGGIANCVAEKCTIQSNFAFSPNGAGAGAVSSFLDNCVISGNTGFGAAGTGLNSTFVNCLIISNSAPGYDVCGNSILENCTVVGNDCAYALYHCFATNCIIYYHSMNYSTFYNGYFKNCCTIPLPSNGVANFTNDPAFVNLVGADYHLQSNSPCINAGNNSYVSGTNDLDGNPRLVGGTVDIGAYEYQSPGSILSYAWAQQYGLPTDGSADTQDTDGDGMNNFAEWKSSTNPTNSLSLLQLGSPVFTNSPAGVVVTWQSVANVTYYLQRSSDLSGAFSAMQSNLVGQAGFTSYTDTSATNDGPYFYRVGVQ